MLHSPGVQGSSYSPIRSALFVFLTQQPPGPFFPRTTMPGSPCRTMYLCPPKNSPFCASTLFSSNPSRSFSISPAFNSGKVALCAQMLPSWPTMAAANSECPGEISYIRWSSTYTCQDMIAAGFSPSRSAQLQLNITTRKHLHQKPSPTSTQTPPITAHTQTTNKNPTLTSHHPIQLHTPPNPTKRGTSNNKKPKITFTSTTMYTQPHVRSTKGA
ncbi:hypothetical protein KC19_8G105000 [Ceratodon purpureus]|uniref:Uncharacterized protein n=1 Tax=Ceratodon purpureus TaxID=3225 RepID=A0A8T0H0N5_CERPU|nr:hypothetical protein KC19_8G105000 [Ceratodon purpureus]